MMYSVWNNAANIYDYYETAVNQQGTPVPMHTRGRGNDLGLAPNQAAWPLPPNARYVGRGASAKGMIAAPRQFAIGLGDDVESINWLIIGGLVGGAYLLKRYLR